jgi:phage terminase large subunit GpA-like protein
MASKPQVIGRPPGPVWFIGTNEAKDLIYQRLELVREVLEAGGPGSVDAFPHGYIHLPRGISKEFLAQLTAEESVQKQHGGQWFRAFENPDKLRNEGLDMAVYALAGERFLNPAYAIIAGKLEAKPDVSEVKTVKKPEKRVAMRPRWRL